jgi:hypothetical protein
MPAAAAAERISLLRATSVSFGQFLWIDRRLPSFVFSMGKAFKNKLAQQQATCTRGPSLPNHKPEATARHCIK